MVVRVLELFVFLAFSAQPDEGYVGSLVCQPCHQKAYERWTHSHHFRSMQHATTEHIVGDFSDQTLKFNGIKTRVFKRKEAFFVRTLDDSGVVKTFPIKYTLGFYPLQQYLVELDKGFVQVLNVAWDNRPSEVGGQRWFHLREGEAITPDNPWHWSRHFQNWNSRCADCHSTYVQKNYDRSKRSYRTTFKEVNIGCEACHGPMAKHVHEKRDPKSPKKQSSNRRINGSGLNALDICGGCHARRIPIAQYMPGDSFYITSHLQLIDSPQYYEDGHMREEVFVLGSFMQSKMYQAGMDCLSCHDPHDGKLKQPGNALCTQCHVPKRYETPQHHHHPKTPKVLGCKACHMPTQTYMSVDVRRDHRFSSPLPGKNVGGRRSVCLDCHDVRTTDWVDEQLKKWGAVPQKVATVDLRSSAQNLKQAWVSDKPPIVRASLLRRTQAHPSPQSISIARKSLLDTDPLLRRAAIESVAALPQQARWGILSPYLRERVPSVRFVLAEALGDIRSVDNAKQQKELQELFQDYRRALAETEDQPSGLLALSSFENRQGYTDISVQVLKEALQIEPSYVPALLNLADFARASKNEAQAEVYLRRALRVAPDSADVQHSFGLYWLRKKSPKRALTYLRTAALLPSSRAHYVYVYAIALQADQKLSDARDVLIRGTEKWPRDYNLLITLLRILEQLGEFDSIKGYVRQLAIVAPEAPETRKFVARYIVGNPPTE